MHYSYPPSKYNITYKTMSTSSLTFSLYILSSSLLLNLGFGADPLFHFCSNPKNFTPHGLYETNLNSVLGQIYYRTPRTGFGLGLAGSRIDRAYGLSLCRGDVPVGDCKTCVVEAGGEIRKRCPYNRGSIIWYDNCLVKYSDGDFFGKIDDRNKFYMYNLRNVSHPQTFNEKTRELLGKLAGEAVYSTASMYAAGEMELGESKKLYGLVQCTRDLSRGVCKKCLEGAISELPRCCDGKEGGRVVGGSCNIRYEIDPFVDMSK